MCRGLFLNFIAFLLIFNEPPKSIKENVYKVT